MASDATEGFNTCLRWLTPSDAERSKASTHRAGIEAKLSSKFGLYRMFESGSFSNGTGVSGRSDTDLFASLKSSKPSLGSSSLSAVRYALLERFPSTSITVRTPAVVLNFGNGYERVEVIPAYAVGTTNGFTKYSIPGVTSDWMESTPQAHLAYVNGSNAKPSQGNAKALARLLKAWKYYQNVPISSFYLEMRAAAYTRTQSSIYYWMDIYFLLSSLQTTSLAAMNDPTGTTGSIRPCSSDATKQVALSKLDTAVTRAKKAFDAAKDGKMKVAFDNWDLLFGGNFPAYY
ncbi:conserved hypothetical protein [Catenulispora acidiphila DSM 44928]|uniref:Nucleotidyltransferase n=1 Tax=Catenulispora acidiphila (strain DSM 44928 / JCM 14897 / NBRC 102108 / NRRL B-24433 / ID139908) TaxID=479433 RepID=C7Q8E9_CATAD|nr:nucleotidyltransferase [Catenulispora acidiphila]ACU76137.1 conserved hypothetical protein [Catenulispora acidiphila DSM 44928]